MSEKESLMRKIMMFNFALVDDGLYLDTHPGDKTALEYFRKHNSLLKQYTGAYEEKYGPLTIYGSTCEDSWDWVENPWPWETGDMSYVEL